MTKTRIVHIGIGRTNPEVRAQSILALQLALLPTIAHDGWPAAEFEAPDTHDAKMDAINEARMSDWLASDDAAKHIAAVR